MIELIVIVVLVEMLVILGCMSLWFGLSSVRFRRKQKTAVELMHSTWLKQQNLYREVLRKRLAALFQVEGEQLQAMVDTVLEREQLYVQQLTQQLSNSLSSPEPQRIIQVVQLMNRQGDIYSQLAASRPSSMKEKYFTLSSANR